MLYGIQTGFGSPQVPVAELLSRPVPTLLSPQKPKSSNFLQVPDMESPRYVRNAVFKITNRMIPYSGDEILREVSSFIDEKNRNWGLDR